MPRKWLFVLPNLFTISSIFCGVYAITQACSGSSAATADVSMLYFYRAAIAVLFGMFFDACDGRVARLTRTASEFGVQLDSLADVVTFGVAPAVLLYEWALSPWGAWGVLIAGLFASCGALRLARFNVMAARNSGPSGFFVGLPIPLAAGMVVAVVVAVTQSPEPLPVEPLPVAILTVVLSWLMVLTVRYHSFKNFKVSGRAVMILGAVILSGAVVANRMGPNFILASYFSAYILFGLVEELVVGRRRRKALSLASTNNSAKVLVDDDDLDEAESGTDEDLDDLDDLDG